MESMCDAVRFIPLLNLPPTSQRCTFAVFLETEMTEPSHQQSREQRDQLVQMVKIEIRQGWEILCREIPICQKAAEQPEAKSCAPLFEALSAAAATEYLCQSKRPHHEG